MIIQSCTKIGCCHNILFDNCTPSQYELLQHHSKIRSYKKNTILFYESMMADNVYMVCDGKIKLWKEGINTHDQIVRLVGNGELIGYRGCLNNTGYYLSATTLTNSQICVIPKDIFIKILEENKDLHIKILWGYVQDLEEIEKKLRNMAEMNVREKTADALMMIMDKFGISPDKKLNLKLSREELSSIAGISTDRIIRQLSEFKKEKIIDLHGQSITILKPEILENIISYYRRG